MTGFSSVTGDYPRIAPVDRGVGENAVAEAELVPVTVGPAHGHLADGVNPAEVCGPGDDHAAPDSGMNPLRLDAQDAVVASFRRSSSGASQVDVGHSGNGDATSATKPFTVIRQCGEVGGLAGRKQNLPTQIQIPK